MKATDATIAPEAIKTAWPIESCEKARFPPNSTNSVPFAVRVVRLVPVINDSSTMRKKNYKNVDYF